MGILRTTLIALAAIAAVGALAGRAGRRDRLVQTTLDHLGAPAVSPWP